MPPKSRYSVADLCKKMEVIERTFYNIIRSPGANFPRPLNAPTCAGIAVYYPAAECDAWVENNFITFNTKRKSKPVSVEDTLLHLTTVKSGVGSVVEFHNAAGSKRIREFLLAMGHKTEIHLRYYPSRALHFERGWQDVRGK